MLIPATFLLTPLFYSLLGYHSEIKFFKLLIYLWYAFFIYLGMTLVLVLKKYKNLAYPIIAGIAFICKNILELPILGIKKNILSIANPTMREVFVLDEIITGEMSIDELQYLAIVVFVSTFLAGCVGVIYARQSSLEFVNRHNTFIFVNVSVLSSIYYLTSGILDVDKNAIYMFIFYLVCLAVSYFLVRNFAHLNRQLDLYAERGAYNVSGTKRIYAYYFTSTLAMSAIPFIFCFLVVPFVVYGIGYIFSAVAYRLASQIGAIFMKLLGDEVSNDIIQDPYAIQDRSEYIDASRFDELMIYYIFLVVFLILIFVFRKHIKRFILEAIEYFKVRFKLESQDGAVIINQETITQLEKIKKSKSSYKDYLKKSKKILGLRERFLFAYNYIFWSTVKSDEDLKESSTPNEVAEKYEEMQNLAELYQDIKYGKKSEENNKILANMIEKAELFLRRFLRN